MKKLSSAVANAIIGEIQFLTEKTKTVAFEKRGRNKNEFGVKETIPVTKVERVTAKLQKISVYAVAKSESKDKILAKFSPEKDCRLGDPVNMPISEKDYLKWITALAVDFYGIRNIKNLDMSLVVYPPFEDVVSPTGEVLVEGVRSKFLSAVA